MTLSVGLFTGMRSHGQFSLEGRRLRLRGWSIHTLLAEAEAYRVGLSSLEGRVEPITSTEDTALNGFWAGFVVFVVAYFGYSFIQELVR